MGDFNIDVSTTGLRNSVHARSLIDISSSYFFRPIIDKPTRVTLNSASVIDNIFSNSVNGNFNYGGIITTDISDHYPVFCITSFNNNSNN